MEAVDTAGDGDRGAPRPATIVIVNSESSDTGLDFDFSIMKLEPRWDLSASSTCLARKDACTSLDPQTCEDECALEKGGGAG